MHGTSFLFPLLAFGVLSSSKQDGLVGATEGFLQVLVKRSFLADARLALKSFDRSPSGTFGGLALNDSFVVEDGEERRVLQPLPRAQSPPLCLFVFLDLRAYEGHMHKMVILVMAAVS